MGGRSGAETWPMAADFAASLRAGLPRGSPLPECFTLLCCLCPPGLGAEPAAGHGVLETENKGENPEVEVNFIHLTQPGSELGLQWHQLCPSTSWVLPAVLACLPSQPQPCASLLTSGYTKGERGKGSHSISGAPWACVSAAPS